jgi:hypothetical protein
MTIQFQRAERRKARLRLGLSGPSGSGKTYSALLLAFGLGDGPIAVIDTEHQSASLYAHLGEYAVATMEAPYSPDRYVEYLHAAEEAGFRTIIIDSLSHAWAAEGGALDQVDRRAANSANKFAAWRDVTPMHNRLVEAMLQSPAHIIATMRSKTEYVLETETRNGRTVQVPRKVGLAPVQRDGMEYEFTVFLDLATDHTALPSKDRTGLFHAWVGRIDQKVGGMLRDWLDSGVEVRVPEPPARPQPAEAAVTPQEAALARGRPVPAGTQPRSATGEQFGLMWADVDFQRRFLRWTEEQGLTMAEVCEVVGDTPQRLETTVGEVWRELEARARAKKEVLA